MISFNKSQITAIANTNDVDMSNVSVTSSKDNLSTVSNTYSITVKTELTVSFSITNDLALQITQETTRNLWEMKKYLDTYIGFLQGALSADEFSEQAQYFIKEKNVLSKTEIQLCSTYLQTILPDIDIDDISMILNVDFDTTLSSFEANDDN